MPYAEPITVTTRTTQLDGNGDPATDAFGDPIYVTSSMVRKGSFVPSRGEEITTGGDLVTSKPQVLFTGQAATDVAAVVDSNSQFTVRGKTYEVDGEPGDWISPHTGWHAGLSVPLKRATGAI